MTDMKPARDFLCHCSLVAPSILFTIRNRGAGADRGQHIVQLKTGQHQPATAFLEPLDQISHKKQEDHSIRVPFVTEIDQEPRLQGLFVKESSNNLFSEREHS